MKKLIYIVLKRLFGKHQFHRFFLVMHNIALQGLNYRNTSLAANGELYLIGEIARFYANKKNLICFDVGANVGNYAKSLAEALPPSSSVYAFEPFSGPYQQLQLLTEKWKIIHPQRLGLSDKKEELTLYSSNTYSEVGGVYNRNAVLNEVTLDKEERNTFTTLSDFVEEKAIPHIHFLKIDVEGHELAVLKGGTTLLNSARIDFIQFEFGSGNYFSKTYFLDFFELLSPNYRLYRLLKDGLIEINSYNSDLEIHILSNYIAIHKNIAPHFFQKSNAV
jgi:FkbM family methyltransferase